MRQLVIIIVVLVCVVVPICYRIWIRPLVKGMWAEAKVKIVLSFLPKEYVVYNDIVISSHGHSSQIDHLVVSPFGIFVIETKSHKGLIYGGENAEYWTQNIWGRKYQLYNPLLQNEGHITALKRLLQLVNSCYIPIVVFTNATNVSVSTNRNVISHWQLLSTIRHYKDVVIEDPQIESICLTLNKSISKGRNSNKNHRQYAKFQARRSRESINNSRCPRCGGKIVLRHGKYGEFYGCSNYPNCHFTMKV